MTKKTKTLFLILVLVQGLHSFEECFGKIWVSFPPATVLCGLVSENLRTGFLIINIGLFVFGVFCWVFPVRKEYLSANLIIWFWIVLQFINGIGHPIWTFIQWGYTPGIMTAPILLLVAIALMREQIDTGNKGTNRRKNGIFCHYFDQCE